MHKAYFFYRRLAAGTTLALFCFGIERCIRNAVHNASIKIRKKRSCEDPREVFDTTRKCHLKCLVLIYLIDHYVDILMQNVFFYVAAFLGRLFTIEP